MKARDFCYWLQGAFEVHGTLEFSPDQMQAIKNHLNMVFKHEIDPSNGSEEHNKELNQIHTQPAPGSASGQWPHPYVGGTQAKPILDYTTVMNC